MVEYLKFRLSAQDNLGIGYGAFSSKLGTEFDIWRGVHTIVHSVDFVCLIEFDTFGTEFSTFSKFDMFNRFWHLIRVLCSNWLNESKNKPKADLLIPITLLGK